jgi:hypothetical protein
MAAAAASAPLLVAAVSAATVGALLGSRRPAHPVGWLLLGLGLLVVANGVASGYVNYGLLAQPGALPGAGYLAGIANGIQVLWLSCVSFVLLLTPTGSLPSPRWRWWARVAAAAPVLLVLLSAVDPQPLLPEHSEVENPLAVPLPTGLLLLSPASPPSSSLPRWWRRPGRWWCASAAPAGWSVSSCAGWR